MMKLQEIIASTLGYEHYDVCFEETEFLLEDLDTKLLDCGLDESLDNTEDTSNTEVVEYDEEEELDLDDFLDGIE